MNYRTLQRCGGQKVSEIALGCEGFVGKSREDFMAMLDRAMELGINFIDMYSSNPEFRDNMGAAIADTVHRAAWGLMWRISINI